MNPRIGLRRSRSRSSVRLGVAAALALASGVLAACGGGSDAKGSSSPMIEIATGVDASFAPVFFADKKGMFKKAGLNVNVTQFAQGGVGVDSLISGSGPVVGISGDAASISRAGRPGLRAISVFENSDQYIKLAVRKGITDVSQVKRFGVAPGSINEYATLQLLNDKGIDPKSVEFVNADPPEMVGLLGKNSIDGFVLWEPWPTQAQKEGATVLLESKDWNYSFAQYLLSRQDWLEKNGDTVKKLIGVLKEAGEMVNKDPEAAAATVHEALPNIAEEQALSNIKEIDFTVRPFDQKDRDSMKSITEFLFSKGVLKAEPDLNTFATNDWN